ncbi:MAG TPA: hypothetical protein VM901_07835 [Bdellovibrionota bacterium]|jgi:hypothetical protein|nr:hypothetical protein [Bdellovibrionota bacterium]
MIKSLLVMGLVTASLGAQAAEEGTFKTFVGKYSVSKENCDMFSLSEMKRAYAQVQKNHKTGADRLVVNLYGDDSSMVIIETGQGYSEDDRTSRLTNQMWSQAWTSENTVRQVTMGAEPSRNVVYYEIDTVTKQGKNLILTNEMSSGRKARITKCVLTEDNG